ncbi:MAG: EAL domain-containing protein [Solirubrobacteraceae bacterium]
MTGTEQSEAVNSFAPTSDQVFVKVVLGVQSLVSRCAPSALIYQATVDGALRLLGGDEVTEREPLEGVPGVLESLHAVKALGVRVALDDFGTGYSTLLNLSHMPVDLLKIAKPFLDALGRDQRNHAGLLAGIVGLGRHLGLMTVAEGIERPEQRALLTEIGCDLGQGILLGRLLEAGGARRLLSAQAGDSTPSDVAAP